MGTRMVVVTPCTRRRPAGGGQNRAQDAHVVDRPHEARRDERRRDERLPGVHAGHDHEVFAHTKPLNGGRPMMDTMPMLIQPTAHGISWTRPADRKACGCRRGR